MNRADKYGIVFVAAALVVAGLGIFSSTSPVVEDFKQLNGQQQASYCAGVFEYGVRNATTGEQKYSFTKATEWFINKAGGVGHLDMKQRDRAHSDLERYRKAGDSSAFEEIGTVCADIIIQSKHQKA